MVDTRLPIAILLIQVAMDIPTLPRVTEDGLLPILRATVVETNVAVS